MTYSQTNMAPALMVSNMVSMKEIQFAQRLADNEKRIRDRALKKLKRYLSVKSSAGPGFFDDDALKLWKGLFYCMYMADKPLTQEDLAEEISGLIHFINNVEDRRCFIKAAFITFGREWNGIDVFRIEKFMMLIRRLLRQVFVHLRTLKWDIREVCAFAAILEVTVVCPEDNVNLTPMGLKLHICDIILEELAKIGGENLEHQVIMAVLQPYFKVLALSKLEVYSKSVREGIIRHLIRQSSLGVEHDAGLKKSNGTVTEDSEDKEMDDAESEDGSEEESVLDPRAGLVDAFIPQLKPDFGLLADALQSIGAVSKVRKVNRERIYRLVNELRDVAKGFYPLALPDRNVDDNDDISDSELEKAVERLQKFGENLLKSGQVEDGEGDIDLNPLKKCRKKKKQSKRKRLQIAKKAKQEESRGLSKKEKKQLDKHQRSLTLKRRQAVENKLQVVAAAAGIPNIINSASISAAERKILKGLCGFEVTSVNSHAKMVSSITGGNSFVVESTKSVISGKKRKNRETTEKAFKKKKNTFTVSDLQQPSKEEFFDDQNPQVKSNTVKTETCTDSTGKRMKEPVTKGLSDNALSKDISRVSALNGSALSETRLCKENDEAAKPNVSEKEATPESEKAPAPGNSDTMIVPDTCHTAATTANNSEKERIVAACDKATAIDDTERGAAPDKSDKEMTSTYNGKAITPDDTDRGTTFNDSIKVVAPKNTAEDTGLVVNFSVNDKQKWFEGDTETTKRSVWDEPLQEGEFEVFIKSKRQIKKEKKKKKVIGLKKKFSKAGSQKTRTISINLKQNKEHEYSDYVRTLRASPSIPFKADMQPKASVLKPSPSPILVKKPSLKKLKMVASSASPHFKRAKKGKQLTLFSKWLCQ